MAKILLALCCLTLLIINECHGAVLAGKARPTTKPPHAAKTPGPTAAPFPVYDNATVCTTDSNCIAIPDPSCCPHCLKVAVNSNDVAEYIKEHECVDNIVCPLYCLLETRVPMCDKKGTINNDVQGTCAMLHTWAIPCGAPDYHECPTGTTCQFFEPVVESAVVPLPGMCFKTLTCPKSSGGGGGGKKKKKGKKHHTTSSPTSSNACPLLHECDSSIGVCVGNTNSTYLDSLIPCGGPKETSCPTTEYQCVPDPRARCDAYGGEPNCPGLCVLDVCGESVCTESQVCTVCGPAYAGGSPVPICLENGQACPLLP